jgi:hypothetical protein
MKTVILGRRKCGALQSAALSLMVYSLASCALPASPAPKSVTPSVVQSAPAQTIRVILYFQRPTENNSQLSAAISEACHCQPVFFRQYSDNALIYIISIPQDHSYAVFENTLLRKADKLGIKAIEQDSVEHF